MKRPIGLTCATLLAACLMSAATASTQNNRNGVTALLAERMGTATNCKSVVPYGYRLSYSYGYASEGGNNDFGFEDIYVCASHELVSIDDWRALGDQLALMHGHAVIMGINRVPASDYAKP